MSIEEVIEHIPELFLFIIPGYITIRIKEKYSLEKHADNFDTIFCSLVYSFIIKIAFSIIRIIVIKVFPISHFWIDRIIVEQSLYLLLSVLLGLFLIKVPKNNLGKMIRRVFNKNLSPYPNVWLKAMENNEGAWATVYLKNGLIYTGQLIHYTSNPADTTREILLTNYRLMLKNSGAISTPEEFSCVIHDYTANNDTKVLLNSSEIVSVEIIK